MPKKLEDCVKSVKEQGKSEQSAYAICNASINDKSNDNKPMKYKICPDSGFMHVEGVSARSGLQDYYGYELGLDGDEAMKIFWVYRPIDEVEKSLPTFNGAVITNNHPENALVTTNDNDLIKGNVSDAKGYINTDGEYYISNKAIITDQSLISDILNGKRELSAGYTRDLLPESGTYKGQPYQFVQRNIRCNHVAVVEEGRCGNACKLNLDNKGKSMIELQLDGKTVSMDAKEVVKHINGLNKSLDEATTKIANMEKEKTEMDGEKEDLMAQIKTKVAEIAALEEQLKSMITPEQAEEMAEENSMMSADAEELGIETKEKTNDGKRMEILTAIAGKEHSFDSMDKASLKTMYKITVDQAKKAKKAQVDGYKGQSDSKAPIARTGNITTDMNAVAKQARQNRKDK